MPDVTERATRTKSHGRPPTCRDVLELLTDYMDGDLPAAVAADLTRHLEGCVACGSYLESLRTTRAAVHLLRCDQVPEEVHERLRAFLRAPGGRA